MAGRPQPDPGGSDHQLVAAANRGDRRAMEALYERHRDWVHSMALRFAGNAEDAADALQETFFYLFGKFPGFELRCQLRSFLYPAVRNISLRLKSRRTRAARLEEGIEPAAPDPAPAAAAAGGGIDELVAGLGEAERDVVVLRFGEGLALDEIAARLAVPVGTVKSRLHRALRSLRERLSD